MRMHEAYLAAWRAARESWQEGDRPYEVTAVAAATGLDPEDLWEKVEGDLGWQTHDPGYDAVAWWAAWETAGFPDWEGTRGDQPVGGA